MTTLLRVCLFALAHGCNTSQDIGARSGAKEPGAKRSIGDSLITLDKPFFKVNGDNVTPAGKKHGYGVTVVPPEAAIGRKSHARQFPQYGMYRPDGFRHITLDILQF